MSKNFNKAMSRRRERKNINLERDPRKKGAKTYKKFGGFKKEETPNIKIDLTYNLSYILTFLLLIWVFILLIKG